MTERQDCSDVIVLANHYKHFPNSAEDIHRKLNFNHSQRVAVWKHIVLSTAGASIGWWGYEGNQC